MDPTRDARTRASFAVIDSAFESSLVAVVQSVLGYEVSLVEMKSGASSTNFRAEGGGQSWVVRVDSFRSLHDVKSDDDYADVARRSGVIVPKRYIWAGTVDGAAVTIRDYVEGSAPTGPNLTSPIVTLAALQLAAIHGSTLQENRNWFYEVPLQTYAHWNLPTDDVIERAVDTVRNISDELLAEVLSGPKRLIHTDYRPDNWLMTRSGLAILDWEKATAGSAQLDFGLAIFHVFALGGHGHAIDFLAAYTSAMKLPIMPEAWIVAASLFFLVDTEINFRNAEKLQLDGPDQRHREYYRSYCRPAFERFEKDTDLAAGIMPAID